MRAQVDNHRAPHDKKVEADFREEVAPRGFGLGLETVGVGLGRDC